MPVQSLSIWCDEFAAAMLICSQTGSIVDAAYFNQLSALNGLITHSGDERTGHADGDDEVITIKLGEITPDIQCIFIVCALCVMF